jgi:hypothetical protein
MWAPANTFLLEHFRDQKCARVLILSQKFPGNFFEDFGNLVYLKTEVPHIMRIAESTLRRIIREEAKKALQEMAWAGSLGVRQSRNQDRESFTSGISTGGANRAGAEKYARSVHFETLAKKHFANIPYDVWTAALIGAGDEAGVDDAPELGKRGAVLDLSTEGRQLLKRLGFQTPPQLGVEIWVTM